MHKDDPDRKHEYWQVDRFSALKKSKIAHAQDAIAAWFSDCWRMKRDVLARLDFKIQP
ncbi:MAG: hypothetical protein Q7R66_09415 [Undibacterium sp.]|uniref:hypothetical protein n=1 Tax=Undibacterium sp. TaxID=1914977 RepID=UPI00271FE733|nr:hypothetical protein [Undibacterium sp.]MDO8652395.1 hypothetical protein [Undibacterium sp.]